MFHNTANVTYCAFCAAGAYFLAEVVGSYLLRGTDNKITDTESYFVEMKTPTLYIPLIQYIIIIGYAYGIPTMLCK
mgnify:CR=1 FL=1